MKSRARRARLIAVIPMAAASSLIISCGGGSDGVTEPKGPTVARITLSDSALTIEAGFSGQLSATLKTASDSVLTGIPVTWQSDNPAVATVNSGFIDALAMGSAKITATASGKNATALVNVIETVVNSVRLSRSTVALPPGRTLQLSADALDRQDRKIPTRVVTYTSSDNSVAEVTGTGLVITKAVGIATITASAADKQAVLNLTVSIPVPLSIVVRASVPEPFLQLSAYSMKARHPDDSTSTTSAFGLSATLTGPMVIGDTVEFIATGVGGSSWPSRMIAARDEMPASVPVVFIPQNIALTSGNFAGVTLDVSLAGAVAPCAVNSDQCRNGFYGTSFGSGVKGWASYPIGVLVDGALDSARVWDALRAMETAAGRKLFVPENGTQCCINVRAGLPPGVSGFGGYTIWNWDPADRLIGATVWLAASPTRALVQHEFLHALGFWHTCSWTSVMGGYGCPQSAEVTPSDIAYVLLASSVYNAEAGFRSPDGQLPCGTMSLWAAIPGRPARSRCFFGNNSISPNAVIRKDSAQ